jgi:ribonuclease BN (tRNA processing enzyme)
MLDLLFLGSGNAFGSEGRAFSSFLLNNRYLFDCGPTVLQQLRKAGISSHEIAAVFISHFHADHFFGLPFLLLDAKYGGRTGDLTIVGPPGIEERLQQLLALGYPGVADSPGYQRRFVEAGDGCLEEAAGLQFTAARVKHVDEFECFAYRAETDGRSLVFSGDTTLCDALLRLSAGADVIVTECSSANVPVHLGPEGVAEVARHAPGAQIVITHLDSTPQLSQVEGLHVAEDLKHFRF